MESNDPSFAIKPGGGSTPGRPSKSIPVDAMARASAQRINGTTADGTQISVASVRRCSMAGSDKMQSPMPPGRMISRRKGKLVDALAGLPQRTIHILNAQVHCFGLLQVVIAHLKMSGHHAIHRAVRRNGVLQSQPIVVLIAEETIVLEHLF